MYRPGTVWGLIVELMRFEVSPGFLSARKTDVPESCAPVAAVCNSKYWIFYDSPALFVQGQVTEFRMRVMWYVVFMITRL
jgi:hypothetical protein